MKFSSRATRRVSCCGIVLMALANYFAFASDPHPSLPPIGLLDGLGVNIHFTEPKPGEMEMIAAAGFKWVRMDFSWGGTEREKGVYDFSAYDGLAAHLDKHKLRALFILDYGNKLYDPDGASPHTDESRAAFAKWAAAAVAHFKGKGYIWELWNEPNIAQFWKPKPNVEDYIALAKATSDELRRVGLIANPQSAEAAAHGTSGGRKTGEPIRNPQSTECFIGPATSTIDLTFLEECFKAGLLEHWAAVSVHPYRQTAPETVEEEYRSVRLLIRKYAPKDKAIPIISSEWGYSTQYPAFAGKSDTEREEMQAKYLARMFLTNIANDIPLSIWYDWHDDGDDPKEAEHHFGLVRHEYREGRDPVFDPKPAYQAAKTLNVNLGNARFNKRLWLDDSEATVLLFASTPTHHLVVWSAESEPLTPPLPTDSGEFYVCSQDGKSHVVSAKVSDSLRIPITQFPQFVTPKIGDRVLQLAAAWTRAPIEIVEHAPRTITFEETVTNPLDQDLQLPGWQNPEKARSFAEFPLEIGQDKIDEAVAQERRDGAESLWRGETVRRSRKLRVVRSDGTDVRRLSFDIPSSSDVTTVFQQLHILADNPIRIEAATPGPSSVPIRVVKTTGEKLDATIEVSSWAGDTGNRVGSASISMSAEAQEAWVLIPSRPVDFQFGDITARLYDRANISTANLPSFRPVEWSKEHLDVLPDGNRAVSVQTEFAVADPITGRCLSETQGFQLKYQFAAGWKFVRVLLDAPVLQQFQPARFGLWLHGDGKGCEPRIRFVDATGQTFQPDGPKIDWTGWRYVTFPMQSTGAKPLAHWGGANDGTIHYPIKWDTIFLLDNISREPIEGEVYLSAPTLIY